MDDRRTEHTLTYSDLKTGLVLRCVGVVYHEFPTVEWTLYFKNTSDEDTPILADIQALDIQLERPRGPSSEQTEFRLHHQVGSPAAENDYQPWRPFWCPARRNELRQLVAGQRAATFLFQLRAFARQRVDRGGGLAGSVGSAVHPR